MPAAGAYETGVETARPGLARAGFTARGLRVLKAASQRPLHLNYWTGLPTRSVARPAAAWSSCWVPY